MNSYYTFVIFQFGKYTSIISTICFCSSCMIVVMFTVHQCPLSLQSWKCISMCQRCPGKQMHNCMHFEDVTIKCCKRSWKLHHCSVFVLQPWFFLWIILALFVFYIPQRLTLQWQQAITLDIKRAILVSQSVIRVISQL